MESLQRIGDAARVQLAISDFQRSNAVRLHGPVALCLYHPGNCHFGHRRHGRVRPWSSPAARGNWVRICRDRLRTQRSLYGVVWLAAGRRVLVAGMAVCSSPHRGPRRPACSEHRILRSRVRLCDLRGLSRRSCSTRPDARGVSCLSCRGCGHRVLGEVLGQILRTHVRLGAGSDQLLEPRSALPVRTARATTACGSARARLRPYPVSTWRCRCTTP